VSSTEPSIVVIIPAYNEAAAIGAVVEGVRRVLSNADVLVIDDGSQDATAQRAEQAGATVLRLPCNLGIGGAVQSGYKFAVWQGYDIVGRVDGDGQHRPEDLALLIREVQSGATDLAIGSRYLTDMGYRGAISRRAGVAMFSGLLTLLLRQRISDATSGLRAVTGELAAVYAQDMPTDYPEIEGIICAKRAGFAVCEYPATMQERQGGESSITPFWSVHYVVKVLLAVATVHLRPSHSRQGEHD
jgi:hypothetical protein